MNSSDSGKRLERFFMGKGFYIVLFLCAAVIGVSAWMMAAGNETMAKDIVTDDSTLYSNKRVETVIITPTDSPVTEAGALDGAAVPAMNDGALDADGADAELAEAFDENTPVWLWPVSGSVERGHSETELAYDVTLRDWRTHTGIDIDAPDGSTVTATRGGTVESIDTDDLYGTVVTIDHGDGTKAVYASLAPEPPVAIGDSVEAGYIIGAVGTSALAEVGQGSHLHFAVFADGQSVDPLYFLQAA